MKEMEKEYVKTLKKENKMLLEHNNNLFEEISIEQYNFRKDVNVESWEEDVSREDMELYSPDEFLEFFENEEVYFV